MEEAIYAFDGVSEVAVIGITDEKWVEAVTAVVVRKAGATLTAEDVIEASRARLAHFKVPKHVFFADALPKNPSGKLLKRELRLQYAGAAR